MKGSTDMKKAKITDTNVNRFLRRITLRKRGNSICWEIQGHLDKDGYGSFGQYRAHRFAYAAFKGPIPEGMQVNHNCPGGDYPPCCNPDHLWLGTQEENLKDAVNKGTRGTGTRQLKTHCKHGHEFTPENTYSYKKTNGTVHRTCLKCRKQRDAERYRKNPQKFKDAARRSELKRKKRKDLERSFPPS